MGLLEPILRELAIERTKRGYVPLLNMMCYAYANPNMGFNAIMDYLEKTDFYVGVSNEKTEENKIFSLRPSMVRTIETALEGTNLMILKKYGLEKLCIILKDRNGSEEVGEEEQLLSEIGEKYAEYDTHEKRIIVFFCKKLLKNL